MVETGLLVKPPTRRADIEALESVRRLRPQAILLNLPESIEGVLNDYGKGNLDYEGFIDSLYEKLPEPKGAWIKEYEVFLRELPSIGELADIYCYTDTESFNQEASTSIEVALLTIRGIIREKIELKEWVNVLKKSALRETEKWGKEFSKILDIARSYDRVVCISGFEGKYIKRRLDHFGVKSWIRYLDQPYHFTPLEILKRLILLDRVDEELFGKLIKEHIRFLKEYIYRMPYTEAVEKWVGERLYWLPIRRQRPD